MDCLINMDCGDCGYETVSEATYTAANSKNICCECEKPIKVGTKFERFEGRLEDNPQVDTYYTCYDCLSVRNAFFHDYVFGLIWEQLEEEFQEGNMNGDCLAKNILKCTENARADIAKLIEEYMPEDD